MKEVFSQFSEILSQLNPNERAALKGLAEAKPPMPSFGMLGRLQALDLIIRDRDDIRLTDTGRVIASLC